MLDALEATLQMFPTCVGMNRSRELSINNDYDVPHMRGDEPYEPLAEYAIQECSPHAWG